MRELIVDFNKYKKKICKVEYLVVDWIRVINICILVYSSSKLAESSKYTWEIFKLDFLQSRALCEKILFYIFHVFFHGELPFADCTIDRGTPCVLFAIKYHAWNHVCRDEIVISRYVNELLAIGLPWGTYLDVSQRLTSNEIRYRHIYISENRYCSTQCFEFLSRTSDKQVSSLPL